MDKVLHVPMLTWKCNAQAMAASAERLVSQTWQGSRERDVYADFNALSLQITMEALFGVDLPAREGRQVTGAEQPVQCSLSTYTAHVNINAV